MHQNCLFVTHTDILPFAWHIWQLGKREIRKLYWGRKKQNIIHPFPARKKQKQKLQNKFMSRCFPTEASKKAEDTTRARQQARRGGGGKRPVWTRSCIVILYSKLLWHSLLRKQVIHSKCEIKTIKGIARGSYWGCQYRLPTGVGRWCGEIRGKKELALHKR